MASYERLFEPGRIAGVHIKNRLVMTPMGVGLANLDGTPGDEMIAYYEARAAGGAGLIMPEICRVDDVTGVGLMRQISVTRDRNVPAIARLVGAVHRHGAKLFLQLHHPGRETYSSLIGGQPVVAPSAIPCKRTQQRTRALEHDEVQHIRDEFIEGAVRAQRAGVDGIELHCAHGYLLEQFLSPYTNKREDEYGGSFENRMRLVLEIIAGIRERCGTDLPVGCRLSVEEFLGAMGVPEGEYIDIRMGVRIVQELERAGIDFIDVSCGIYETGATSVEPVSYAEGWRHDLIAAVRAGCSLPIIAVSAYRGPEVPERFLEEGIIDFAGLGRAWLADSDWGRKVQEGRVSEIRKCISCLRCFESLEENTERCMPLECAVNAECANERRYGPLVPDTGHHHLVVVGAGPGGLAAAEVGARRGMRVTLLEADDRIGGDVNLAGRPPHKEKMGFVADYYGAVLPELGVDIHLGERATADSVMALSPDAVICATGGRPIVPDLPGIGGDGVATVPEVLNDQVEVADRRVVVVGAGLTGLETAEYVADQGAASTTVVDMVDTVAPGANATNVADVMGRLRKQGVTFELSQKLVAVSPRGVSLEGSDTGEASELAADLVVLSLGNRPNRGLADELRERGMDVQVVGSAVQDGNISPATHGGYLAARSLFMDRRPQASFHLADSEVERFGSPSVMGNQQGVYIAYTTTPEAIARALPPGLSPFPMPVVALSLNHVNNPSFTDDYYEAILGVYCYAGEQLGQYSLSLLLGGDGAEMATQLGRDNGSMPKKLGGEFVMRRDGDRVTACLSRRGRQVVNAEMDLGEYNSPLTSRVFQAPAAGKTTQGCSFYYHFDRVVRAEGGADFTAGALLGALVQYDYKSWEPAYVTRLDVCSTPDDPWGELPVVTVIGAGLATLDLTVRGMRRLADVDAKATMPYLLSSWYDRTTLRETGRI